MGKVKATPQFSEFISSFCKLMENAQKDYAWNYDEVNRMDIVSAFVVHPRRYSYWRVGVSKFI